MVLFTGDEWLALVRITLGLFWLQLAIRQWRTPEQINGFLTRSSNPIGIYGRIISKILLPHKKAVALIFSIFQLIGGISLTFGIVVPVGAAMLSFLNLNIMLAKKEDFVRNLQLIALQIIVALSAASTTWAIFSLI
ncbi:MAG: hypothetical protein O6846_03195 [Thaumarchaeota archaeon]|nr:hypothetical protein [Nitrososphaerota archaeon]